MCLLRKYSVVGVCVKGKFAQDSSVFLEGVRRFFRRMADLPKGVIAVQG